RSPRSAHRPGSARRRTSGHSVLVRHRDHHPAPPSHRGGTNCAPRLWTGRTRTLYIPGNVSWKRFRNTTARVKSHAAGRLAAGWEDSAMKRDISAASRRAGRFAGIVALSLVAAACGSGAKGSSGTTTIGLITKTETNPFFVKMKEGAEKEAKAKG